MQVLCKEIASEQPVIQQVDSNASQSMASMPNGPERDVLKYKLADIDRRFAAVTEKSTQRKQTLDSLQPLAEQYNEVLQAFTLYLEGAEEKVESLKKVPRDEESAVRHKAEAQVTYIWRYSCGDVMEYDSFGRERVTLVFQLGLVNVGHCSVSQ